MKIIMLDLAAGPNGVLLPGIAYEVRKAIGQPLLDGGYAKPGSPPPKAKQKVPTEGDGKGGDEGKTTE